MKLPNKLIILSSVTFFVFSLIVGSCALIWSAIYLSWDKPSEIFWEGFTLLLLISSAGCIGNVIALGILLPQKTSKIRLVAIIGVINASIPTWLWWRYYNGPYSWVLDYFYSISSYNFSQSLNYFLSSILALLISLFWSVVVLAVVRIIK